MALVLTCGISFSGKSTFAAGLAERLGATVVSLDRINEERGLDGGQGIPLAEWATTNEMAHDRARADLVRGAHVVVDDTGSPRFIRDAWRAIATASGASFVLVWIRISPDLQRERVRANRATQDRPDVTDAVLEAHAADFEEPDAEDPVIVEATATADPVTIAAVAAAVRAARGA